MVGDYEHIEEVVLKSFNSDSSVTNFTFKRSQIAKEYGEYGLDLFDNMWLALVNEQKNRREFN